MAEIAQAVYVGTLGTNAWLGGGEEEDEPPSTDSIRGSVWMHRRIREWLGLEVEDEELTYSLDPNAKPDSMFLERVGSHEDQQGRPLMQIHRIKADQFTGPFADRLRQVIAEKEALDERPTGNIEDTGA